MSAETSDGQWLSYDQLASLRRIDKPSAVKLATRNRWPRRKNNVGQMQVCVPLHWLERARGRHDKYTAPAPDDADISTDMSRIISALESAVASLTARAEAAEKRADLERVRADLERDRADNAQDLAQEAIRAATELRQAEEQRKARGRWARLRAAWAGRQFG
jgi:hypothetical protein